MKKIRVVLKSMRIPFLILTPVCVLLGGSIVVSAGVQVSYFYWLLVLLGAVSAHVSVNTLNEYLDFHSGLDAQTVRTPFSGGSGALIENPEVASSVLKTAIVSLGLTILTGLYFVFLLGVAILPLGILGLAIILIYTQWINRHPFLCLLAPGLAFGPLMVTGSYFALTGEYSTRALYVSLVPFFLVNNLLLLNQFPDIEADKTVGRNHFPIAYGTRVSTLVYGSFLILTGIVVIVGVKIQFLPDLSYIALAPLLAAVAVIPGILRNELYINKLIPYLGLNVMMTVAIPALLAITLIVFVPS